MDITAQRRWALLAELAIVMCFPAPSHSQEDTQEKWMARHWSRALVHFFPQPDADDFVAYRFLDGPRHEIPEYSFRVVQFSVPTDREHSVMVAYVREASPQSLYEQLGTIYQRNPSLSDHAVQKLLKVRHFRIPESKCPALKTQLNNFVHFQFLPPKTDRMELAGPSEDLWATDGDISISLSIDAGGSEKNFPMIVWAHETRQILDTCYAQLKKKP
jgi:hypothetical protein